MSIMRFSEIAHGDPEATRFTVSSVSLGHKQEMAVVSRTVRRVEFKSLLGDFLSKREWEKTR